MSATQPVSAERKSAVYYYDNLTDTDQLKVRKAMDMAIPREAIINSLLQGLGLAIASPIEANVIGYDPTITPRDYNIEAALDLMEEVFDYRYNDSADTAEDREGYFPMVLMVPTSREDRMQWAALVTKSFQEIGIDTTLKYANWNIAIPRVFSPAEGETGFDYEHGGYDAFFNGWYHGNHYYGNYQTDVSPWFGVDMYPPAGRNIEYCASQEVKDIINASLQDPVLANRLAKIKEFQQWFYDNVPYFIIRQGYDIWAKDPELKGVDTGFTYPNYRNWTHSTQTAINVHSLGGHFNLDPMLSFDGWLYTKEWYDSLITNYPDDPSVYYGNLAYDNWTTSADGLVWDFWIREGIKFSDGTEMTIDDVVFSLKRFLHPSVVDSIAPYSGEFVSQYINASSIEIVSGNQFRVTLNSFHAYASDFFTFPILSEAEMSPVDDLNWGNWPSDADAGIVPTGTGPFMMDEEATDLANGTCVMVQNPYYDGSLRDPHGQYVNDNILEKITVKVGTTAAAAVADLSNSIIDIIDSRAGLTPFLAQLNSTDNADWSEVVLALEWGHQAFHINQFSPYWGINPADPHKFYPGDYDDVPFDLAALFFGILCLATFQIFRKRKI